MTTVTTGADQSCDAEEREHEIEGGGEEEEQRTFHRLQVHGTNPQFLVEKIMRERIYESLYWKSSCFQVNCHLFIDRAEELTSIGGSFGNQQPTPFMALLLKLLQIQPEPEIRYRFLATPYFKYLTALTAIYVRLTDSPINVYTLLEPLLIDRRKLRRRNQGTVLLWHFFNEVDGKYSVTYMDEFVDALLTEERVCDTILPRLTHRYILEDSGELEPRVSPMQAELDALEDKEDFDSDQDGQLEGEGESGDGGHGKAGMNSQDAVGIDLQDTVGMDVNQVKVGGDAGTAVKARQEEDARTDKKKKTWSKSKLKGLFKATKASPAVASETGGDGMAGLTVNESNKIRATLGLKLLE